LVRRDTFEFLKFVYPMVWSPYMHEAMLFSKAQLIKYGWNFEYIELSEFPSTATDIEQALKIPYFLVDIVKLEVGQSRGRFTRY